MTTSIPPDLQTFLDSLDTFIATTITPLQQSADNERFFDHRREHARTDWDRGGLPRHEWLALLSEAVRLADVAGFWRTSLPRAYGGRSPHADGRGMNLWMAVAREHMAAKGLGLHNDLQNEHSVVGNFPTVVMALAFGRVQDGQRERLVQGILARRLRVTFGLTEAAHGSDATWMETRAERCTREGKHGWSISGSKAWQTGMDVATHSFLFARTSGKGGDASGITCFVVPVDAPGFQVRSYEWTFNMPTDHATVSLDDVWVPADAVLGEVGEGLAVAQSFVHENRIRQAASSLGAAVFCIRESVRYARERRPFGKALASNQAIQFPLVELHTQAEMLRLLVRDTAARMDQMPQRDVEMRLSDRISMCNYWANRLCCQAADQAIQVHGGIGYSRHKPFEHIYRHHRRYRITEGSEEIQMRKIAAYMFGFAGPNKKPKTDVETAKM